MKLKFLTIFATLATFSLLIWKVESNKELCKELVGKLLKGQLEQITNCMQELNLKEAKDKVEKMSCVLKCVLQKGGFITGDGKVSEAEIRGFIDKNIPPDDKERAINAILPCQGVADALKPSEENCKSYDALIKCAMGAMNRFCEG